MRRSASEALLADREGASQSGRGLVRRILRLTSVVVVILAVLMQVRALGRPVWAQDEAILLVYSKQLLNSRLPFVDFSAVYPAGSYAVVGPLVSVFGNQLLVVRILSLVGLIATMWAVWSLFASRRTARLIAIASLCVTWPPFAIVWSLAATCLSVSIALILSARSATWRIFLGSFFLGLAFSIRFDFSLAAVVLLVLLLFARPVGVIMWPEHMVASVRWRLVCVLPAFLLGAAPALLNIGFLVTRGDVGRFLRDTSAIRLGRALPLQYQLNEVLTVAGFAAVSITFVVLTARRWKVSTRMSRVTAVWLVSVTPLACLQFLQRADVWHMWMVLSILGPPVLLALSLLAWDPAVVATFRSSTSLDVLGLSGLVLLVWINWSNLVSFHPREIASSIVNTVPTVEVCGEPSYCLPLSPESASDLEPVLSMIRQRPGRSLFEGPSDLRTAFTGRNWVYALFPENPPCSFYLEMNPGSSNGSDSHLADELAGCDLLLLDDSYNALHDEHSNVNYGSDQPNAVVKRSFHELVASGPWTLYARNDGRG